MPTSKQSSSSENSLTSTELTSVPVTSLPELSGPSSNSASESGNSTNPRESKPQLWKPGQSGNPSGRPKGSKNQITLLKISLEQSLRENAAPRMSEVLDKAIDMALKGHPGMIKLLLELHMSKSGDTDDKQADDKITININQMPDSKLVQPVIIEGEKDSSNEDKL